jgi:hypothetical protein
LWRFSCDIAERAMISWLMIAGIVFVALVVAAFFIFSRGND